jgi:hypothetical protein
VGVTRLTCRTLNNPYTRNGYGVLATVEEDLSLICRGAAFDEYTYPLSLEVAYRRHTVTPKSASHNSGNASEYDQFFWLIGLLMSNNDVWGLTIRSKYDAAEPSHVAIQHGMFGWSKEITMDYTYNLFDNADDPPPTYPAESGLYKQSYCNSTAFDSVVSDWNGSEFEVIRLENAGTSIDAHGEDNVTELGDFPWDHNIDPSDSDTYNAIDLANSFTDIFENVGEYWTGRIITGSYYVTGTAVSVVNSLPHYPVPQILRITVNDET